MKNLLSNTNFGLYLNTLNISDYEYRYLRTNFDLFLLRDAEIWMFVPCKLIEGVWVVLEEPVKNTLDNFNLTKTHEETVKTLEFQEAKELCLFEGFEVVEISKNFRMIANTKLDCQVFSSRVENVYFTCVEFKTIESLVKYQQILTKTALKRIGVFNYCKG